MNDRASTHATNAALLTGSVLATALLSLRPMPRVPVPTVDPRLTENARRAAGVIRSQRAEIAELRDENFALRAQVTQLHQAVRRLAERG